MGTAKFSADIFKVVTEIYGVVLCHDFYRWYRTDIQSTAFEAETARTNNVFKQQFYLRTLKHFLMWETNYISRKLSISRYVPFFFL